MEVPTAKDVVVRAMRKIRLLSWRNKKGLYTKSRDKVATMGRIVESGRSAKPDKIAAEVIKNTS